MRTKLVTFFLALVISVGTLFAESGTCGDSLTWDLNDGILSITGVGDMTNWNYYSDIPWYSCREGITSVTIENGVTSIGDYAFCTCSNLSSVIIPHSVTSIGNYAFSNCSGMMIIEIPNSISNIGSRAFQDCSSLKSIVVENSNTFYDSRNNCNAIIETATNILVAGCQNTIIPNGVTSIEERAFYKCTSLKSVTIPHSVKSIGYEAFRGCTGLMNVIIGDSVTRIDHGAFSYCPNMKSVTIGNGISSIGQGVFYDCSSLVEIMCKAVTPPTCDGSGVFYNVNKTIPLYVPINSVSDYKVADVWEEFTNIQAIQAFEGIENLNLESQHGSKFSNNGQILILRGDKTYTLTGQEIK